MTAFTTANIPSAITTIEQLMVWGASHLSVSQNATVRLTPTTDPQPVASVVYGSDSTNQPKVSVVLYMPYDPAALLTSTGKGWLSTQAVSTVALPSTWTSN
jgi:hypothetical protein